MLTGLSRKVITYDGENRPITVTFAGQTTNYTYAPDGTRTKMVAPHGTYVFVSPKLDYYYASWGAIMAGFYPHPNARDYRGVKAWVHRDHLNPIRFMTNTAGSEACP